METKHAGFIFLLQRGKLCLWVVALPTPAKSSSVGVWSFPLSEAETSTTAGSSLSLRKAATSYSWLLHSPHPAVDRHLPPTCVGWHEAGLEHILRGSATAQIWHMQTRLTLCQTICLLIVFRKSAAGQHSPDDIPASPDVVPEELRITESRTGVSL